MRVKRQVGDYHCLGHAQPKADVTQGAKDLVVRFPRTVTISFGISVARRTSIPARAEIPMFLGTVTSMASRAPTSRPCSHAAVRPENTASGGSLRRAASILRSGVSGRPAHAYTLGPILRQLAPSRFHRDNPARRPSSRVKGAIMSPAGTSALRPMKQGWDLLKRKKTLPVKAPIHPVGRPARVWGARNCLRRPANQVNADFCLRLDGKQKEGRAARPSSQ